MKNALLICIFVVLGFFVFDSIVSASPLIQNDAQISAGNGQRSVNQGRDQIAALPASPDVAPVRSALNPASSASGVRTPPYSTFYRQASTQGGVYNYPATGAPRVASGFQSNFPLFRNNAQARVSNQMLTGSNTSTGSLGPPIQTNVPTPINDSTPYAAPFAQPNRNAGSRSPVEQQRSSTISQVQSFTAQRPQFTSAQQAQAQANQLARLAQMQQAQVQQTLAQAQQAQARAAQIAQPTVAYRQPVLQQPTLGLGLAQTPVAQNCRCTTGFTPTGTYNPAVAARIPYNAPGVAPMPVKLQNYPVGTYVGRGIVGQPKAYIDGQPMRNLFRYITP